MNIALKRILAVFLLGSAIATWSHAQVFTVEIPLPTPGISTTNVLIAPGDQWHWRRGTNAPQPDWHTTTDVGIDGSWSLAPGGFGFGDDAIVNEATRVDPGMAGVHTTLYIRRTLPSTDSIDTDARLVLTVDYDDGFVAYLDGMELARRNVPGVPGSPVSNTATTGGVSHEASCCQSPNPPVVIDLGPVGDRLAGANHVLALIGVNQSSGSSDFHLIAGLATVRTTPGANTAPVVMRGLYAWTTTNQVVLSGSNTITAGVRVTVNGDEAAFDSGQGTWSKDLTLQPGWNNLYLAVHDIYGSILSHLEQGIVYEAGALQVGGNLPGVTVWNDPSIVVNVFDNVVVPAGARLEIGAGVVVILAPAMSITAAANGLIGVQGTDEKRALFLPANTEDWGWLMASGANAVLNLLYAEVVAGQVRVDDGGDLLIEDTIIRDLPDAGREVIQAENGLSLTMRRVYMTRFAEGDSFNTPVLVEDSLMEGFLVDGMDLKATSSPLVVRRSTFRNADPNNSNADAIDFGPGAGTVDGCLIHDFPDKGVSIGGAPGTVIRNSLIYRCGIGVSAYASSGLLIENSTIAHSLNGILFRDNPTRAVGAASNLIVWNNTTNLAILNTSVLAMDFSDVQGTNYPGTGNLSVDPLFAAPAQADYRLDPGSPAIGAAADGGNMGVRFPVGGIPSAPAQLIALSRPHEQAQLIWTDTAENEDGVRIERSPDRVSWQVVGNAPANSTTFNIPLPPPAESVYYRVRATNDVGVSHCSNPARPVAAVNLVLEISHLSPGQVVLGFSAAEGKSYVLQARPSLGGGDWTNWMAIPAAEPGPYLITNDLAGAEAYFRLMTP